MPYLLRQDNSTTQIKSKFLWGKIDKNITSISLMRTPGRDNLQLTNDKLVDALSCTDNLPFHLLCFLPNLHTIELINIPLNKTDVKMLFSIIETKNISSLTICGGELDNDSMGDLATFVGVNHYLTTLNLSCNSITNQGLIPLAQALSKTKFSTIEAINLSNNNIGEIGIVPSDWNLSSLINHVVPKGCGVQMLFEAIARLPTLKKLSMQDNHITSATLNNILPVLEKNSTLTEFTFANQQHTIDPIISATIGNIIGRNKEISELQSLAHDNGENSANLSSEFHDHNSESASSSETALDLSSDQATPVLGVDTPTETSI